MWADIMRGIRDCIVELKANLLELKDNLYVQANSLGQLLDMRSQDVSGLVIKGVFEWILEDINTGHIERGRTENVFTDAGRSGVISCLRNQDVDGITYFAVGTGTTTPAISDIALETEADRVAVTSTRESPPFTARLSAFAGPSALVGTFTEVGMFGVDATIAAGSGTLFARTLSPITKTDTQSLTFLWNFTLTADN